MPGIKILPTLLTVWLIPTAALAQGTMTGVVTDTTGAILPGVTIEATSPTSIEKVRTALTDGAGRYQIVDLRPGVYSVTFTVSGFAVVKRDASSSRGPSRPRLTPSPLRAR
jgi:hypothetical protein